MMRQQEEKQGQRRSMKYDSSIYFLCYPHDYLSHNHQYLSLLSLLLMILLIILNNNDSSVSWVMTISDTIPKIKKNITVNTSIRSLLSGSDEYHNENNSQDNTIVSTLLCSQVRSVSSFAARLELEYLYLIENISTNNNSLEELSDAILQAILQELNNCEKNYQAQYALDRSILQSPIKEGNFKFTNQIIVYLFSICLFD